MVEERWRLGGGGVWPLCCWLGGGADGGGAKDGGIWGAAENEPDVFERCTLGGPVNPWPAEGGPGVYGPEVDWGAKDAAKGLPYWEACWSLIAAFPRPVPSVASGGGGVFSR